MTDFKTKWWEGNIKKFGSVEAVREAMRENQRKGRLKKKRREGGFKHMKKHDPKRLKQISKEAIKKRYETNI